MAAGKPTPFVDTTSSGRESLKIMARASLASSSVPTALVEPTHVPIGDEELLPVAHVADESVREVLWGDAPQSTTGLAYIESHAMRMRARVRREDPHSSYLPLRSKSLDVRLFKVATLIATTPLEHERCDFRGVTRVPGDLDTVLGLLASEDARESYWVALNTQRGLLVHSLVATRRLTDAAFPRWNQRYSAIKFSKQAPPVECCVSEYAAYDDPEDEDEDELAARRTRVLSQDVVGVDGKPLRSAFVYRRSIDHRLFNMEDVQDKLRQYGERCERLYVQDFLYEIAETPEKHTCKVVLTCSVYLTNAHGQLQHEAESEKLAKSLRHEYREFCTQSLLSLRQVMANQWVEKMTYAGVVSKSSNALRSLLSGGSATRSHQPLHCGVCSAAFSLLKKRHVCHECGLVVCSRCCVKPAPTPPSPQPQDKQMTGSQVLKAMATAHDRQRPTRECILCTQFGNDSGGSDDLRVSVSIRRHFTNSTTLSSLAPGELPDDTLSDSGLSASNQMSEDQSDCGDLDDEEVHVVEAVDDLDALDGNQAQDKPVKPRNLRVRASTEDNTITTAWREPGPELAPPYRAMPPTIAIQQPVRRRFKQRAESVNLATPAPSPGLVLLTEIDTLSLTGSFRLDGSASSAASRRGSGSSDTGHRSRRGSGASDAGRRSGGSDAGSVASTASAPSAHNFVRASPALPPRRARRSVSEDTTRPPTSVALEPLAVAAKVETGEDEEDDLANFNLQLL